MPEGLTRSNAYSNEQLLNGFDRYMLVTGRAVSTRKCYRYLLGKFARFLGSESAINADRQTIRRFLAERSGNGFKSADVYRCRSVLSAFYKWLHLAGIVRSSPVRLIQVPKFTRKLPRFLTEAEIERLMAAAASPRDRAVCELLYASGLRRNECASLKIEDLHLNGGTFMVRHGKGGKDRLALMGSRAIEALRCYLGGRRHGPVFVGIRGAMSANSIARAVTETARRAGLQGVVAHSLRHSFATHLLNRGADIRYVQKLLGHVSLSATQIYTHLAIADLQKTHAQCHPKGDEHGRA